MRAAVVLCGPVAPDSKWRDRLPESPLVIAADVGYRHAQGLGLRVDVLVGDLDSLDAAEVETARQRGARVERHPVDKSETDLELALNLALVSGCVHAVVVDGGVGPRVDHFLANALLLAHSRYAPMGVDAAFGNSWLRVVRSERGRTELRGEVGSLVTLLAIGGPAEGVRTSGLKWPLEGEALREYATRGVSNELVSGVAHIEVASGVIVSIQPESGVS